MMESSKTITRALVSKTEHEANAILDMTKQLMIHNGGSFAEQLNYAVYFYEEREKKFNELTGKK